MSAISTIRANVTIGSTSNMQSSSTFSADQKNSIQSILGKFDSKNLSVADAKKITTEFKTLGIQPGRELAETMAASGFDAKQVGDLAFGQGQPPGAGAIDLPPNSRTNVKFVKSVTMENDGHEEEQIYRRTDHWFLEAGRSGHANQGVVPQRRL